MNRQLNKEELENARKILAQVRVMINNLANGDRELGWALRRKIYKELIYDERGKPMARRMLKAKLVLRQKGACADCKKPLPEKNSVLDRLEAMKGYTIENTRLLCPKCDQRIQENRNYS